MKRAAINMNITASSNYQPKGDREGRAAHITAKATDNVEFPRNAMWAHIDVGSLRGIDVSTLRQVSVEQERPYLAAAVGQGVVYKAGQLKGRRAGRESEGLIVPKKAAINRRRERALLWSRLDEGKCEGMSPTATNNPEGKA